MKNTIEEFKERKNEPSLHDEEQKIHTVGYTFKAQEIYSEDVKCLAKKTKDSQTKSESFWIKKNTNGTNAGQFFNHLDMNFKENESFVSRRGQAPYEFVKVNRDCFAAYLRFLSTENTLHLRHAERCR